MSRISVERQAAHVDGTDLGKVDRALAADGEEILDVLVAEELHVDRVAGTDHVVDRHRNVGVGRERRRDALEQVVAERLERRDADGLERQERERRS